MSSTHPFSRRTRPFLALLFVVSALVLGLPSVSAPGAQAAAGVPAAPSVLYAEDFDNAANGSRTMLDAYTGATGQTYTASAPWLSATNCNGIVVDQSTPYAAPDCTANGAATPAQAQGFFHNVQQLANVLGQVGGTTPATNGAVTAYTANNPGANNVEFQTATPISLPAATGRFVTFSVDSAAVNCDRDTAGTLNDPQLAFFLKDSGGEHAVSSSPILPCSGSAFTIVNSAGANQTARAGRYVANGSFLLSGSSFDVVMRNLTASGVGNDHAYDNIRVLDVTPTLDKSFSPTTRFLGETSTLTFTVTNTSELGSKNGWSFTDHLPSGLTVVGGTASTTCPSGVVTAAAGSTSVAVAGNLSVGMASCTVTVKVTATATGTYTNGPTNVDLTGLNPPGISSVTFTDQPKFTCDAYGYLYQTPTPGSHPIYQVDLATGTYSNAGSTTDNVNAVG
jgi:uncharacterized repeat protein (TIGR01451 family)